jgi:plasmid stability protein
MAMTLRLNEDDTEALRAYAEAHGQSMQQAAQEAIRRMLHDERRAALIKHIVTEDSELLHRLAQ